MTFDYQSAENDIEPEKSRTLLWYQIFAMTLMAPWSIEFLGQNYLVTAKLDCYSFYKNELCLKPTITAEVDLRCHEGYMYQKPLKPSILKTNGHVIITICVDF